MLIGMNFYKKIGIVLATLFLMLMIPIGSVHANDAAKKAVCEGLQGVSGQGCNDTTDGSTINKTVTTVINILSLITAVIAVFMLIIGGLKYITSSGDSGSTASARNTIIYALVGLVIVALAQLIVKFVIERVAQT